MNRRTFLKSAAAASAGALLRPIDAEAALPTAKITRIRLYEAPTVMPLQIPLLQSNMVVTIETDANITGIGEGGTRDTIEPCAGRLIGKNPFHIERLWQDMYRAFHYPPGRADEGTVFRPTQTLPLKPGDFMRHPKDGPHYDGALDEDTWVAISGYGPTKATVIDGGELFGRSR